MRFCGALSSLFERFQRPDADFYGCVCWADLAPLIESPTFSGVRAPEQSPQSLESTETTHFGAPSGFDVLEHPQDAESAE